MAKRILDDTFVRMAGKFRIFADPSRLAILYCLMEAGEMSVGQVVEAAGRKQTNVSKHLKQMARAGILARRKDGLQVFYRLEDPVWEQVCRLVSSSLRKGTGE